LIPGFPLPTSMMPLLRTLHTDKPESAPPATLARGGSHARR
jgi:hypothetical protein